MKKFTVGMTLSEKINILADGSSETEGCLTAAVLVAGPISVRMVNDLNDLEIYGRDIEALLIGVCEGSLSTVMIALRIEKELGQGDLRRAIEKHKAQNPDENYADTAENMAAELQEEYSPEPARSPLGLLKEGLEKLLADLVKTRDQVEDEREGVVSKEVNPAYIGKGTLKRAENHEKVGTSFDEENTVGKAFQAEPDILKNMPKAKTIK